MKLEDEIKTKAFRNERQKLTVNLLYTYGWLLNRNNKLFQKFGLTLQQYNILRILRGQYPKACNLQLLKDRMLDKQSDCSRLVDRLSRKGLIDRETSLLDRRKLDVKINQAGLDLLIRMNPEIEIQDDRFDAITEEETKLMNILLDRLRDSS
jgi:DNA-binding MarR family transcriptional regulator